MSEDLRTLHMRPPTRSKNHDIYVIVCHIYIYSLTNGGYLEIEYSLMIHEGISQEWDFRKKLNICFVHSIARKIICDLFMNECLNAADVFVIV